MNAKTYTRGDTSRAAFDPDALRVVLEAHETDFAALYDMERVDVPQVGADFYLFKDNGASILAVAHLDTVGPHHERTMRLVETAGGPVVYSRALDDRLGAYVLAELLPSIDADNLTFDLLLTVGEEDGQSTAAFFHPSRHHDRTYNWIIEFDRGGTDVVLYQYEDRTLVEMVEDTGARVEAGIFSDISYMEHVGVKALNWGVGYRDYHGPRAHVWLDDMFRMVDYFLDFHAEWANTHLPHEPLGRDYWRSSRRSFGSYAGESSDGWRVFDAETDEYAKCVEWEWDAENCDGDLVEHPTWGPLCTSHMEWYTD